MKAKRDTFPGFKFSRKALATAVECLIESEGDLKTVIVHCDKTRDGMPVGRVKATYQHRPNHNEPHDIRLQIGTLNANEKDFCKRALRAGRTPERVRFIEWPKKKKARS